MAAPQEDVANLNRLIDEIMHEDVEAVEEVQSENQLEEEGNVEKGNQPEEEEQPEKEITEEEKDFISPEAKELWNKVMSDKEFVCESGFGKLVSPFSEVIKKKRLGILLRAQGTRICSSCKRILCKYGGNER